ncbi:MAG: hypothetical protein AB1649_23605, partial [Chloroflexota bacterium]
TVTVTDNDGGVGVDTLMATVLNMAPEVTTTIDPERLIEVQYSDPIDAVTFTAIDVPADTMNVAVSYSTDGGITFTAGLPDDATIVGELTLDGDSNQIGTGIWTLSGIADLAPGTYIIRVVVSDKDDGSTTVDIRLTVLPEHAFATYVGAQFVSTPSATESTAVVELRAVIQDITVVDPVADPHGGDIRMATVTFVNRETGGIIAADVPVELINGDIGTGAATFEWTVNLVPFPVREFRVYRSYRKSFCIKDLRQHNIWYR